MELNHNIIYRKYPENLTKINFNFKNDNFGMLNLCCWENEVHKIHDFDEKVINDNKINIYFPIFDYFYVKSYSSNNGFTFKVLIEKIVDCGIKAGTYDILQNPDHYLDAEKMTGKQFVNEYAIMSYPEFSDIRIIGNNVYISVQH